MRLRHSPEQATWQKLALLRMMVLLQHLVEHWTDNSFGALRTAKSAKSAKSLHQDFSVSMEAM